jgi:hypothetical protein
VSVRLSRARLSERGVALTRWELAGGDVGRLLRLDRRVWRGLLTDFPELLGEAPLGLEPRQRWVQALRCGVCGETILDCPCEPPAD